MEEAVEMLTQLLAIMDKNMTILTLLTLLLNVIVLLIVAYQTYLTRNSLNIAKTSIDENRKARQIENLPDVNYIIEVKVTIERWRTKCKELAKSLEKVIKEGGKDVKLIHEISKQGEKSPQGLVRKYIYESAPRWSGYILMSAAQHYYNSACLMKLIWDEKEQKPKSSMLNKDLVQRFKESSYYLTEILNYINDVIPEFYLETPASIKDEYFLSN